MSHVPLIATTRGPLHECEHAGSIAVVDLAGRFLDGVGEREAPQFSRSTLKPFQALPFLREGGMERWGFGSRELALLCSSHNGETIHARLAAAMLARIGAGAGDLQCGCHEPYYYAAARSTPPGAGPWSPLQHNCSGKHAGFLAYCRMLGEPLAGYLDPAGRVQTRVREAVFALCGQDAIGEGTDGCSAPNFALPLPRLAHLYARLAADPAAEFRALHFAMTRHPDLVSGTARFDFALSQAGAGDWVGKVGADGVYCVGVRSRAIGIAVRVLDGSSRAVQVVAVEALHQLGLLENPAAGPLAPWFRPPVRSLRGRTVGATVPRFGLARLR